jgi:DNA-binding response OmpR family regulator
MRLRKLPVERQPISIHEALLANNPPRVLLAEDDHDMRALLAETLRREGYEVIEARDGTQLLHFIARLLLSGNLADPPDLIISDVLMPGQNGLDVLVELRRADWRIPVILITAFGDEELHGEAARWGASAVLDKPFELDDLRRAVQGVAPHF